MSRPIAILIAAVGVVVAGVGLIDALAQTTLHYSLPSRTGFTSHTATFAPAVVAARVAGVVLVLTLVWLGFAAVGRSTLRMVYVMIGLVVVDVVVLFVVSGLERPSF